MEEKSIRTILYDNLERAVEANSRFAISNLSQAFQKYFPNPEEEIHDKNTFLRSLVNTFARGWDEITPNSFQDSLVQNVFQAYSNKKLLLGSRLLLKKVDETAMNKLLVEPAPPSASSNISSAIELKQVLARVNEQLKAQAVSSFNVTLWDIIYQGLLKKLDENGEKSITTLKITILSMQELSELFDENGLPRQIGGLTFLTSKNEIDEYLEQVSPYLRRLGIISSEQAIKVELMRIPLYDHSVIDPRSGETIEIDKYLSQIATFARQYENSDLCYVHCYAGKQRSPMVVGSLAIYENIEIFDQLMEKILSEKATQFPSLLSLPVTQALLSSEEQTVLNHLFQTPYEIFQNIRRQRKQAKTLFVMKPKQRQIIYQFFFKCILELPDKRYKELIKDTLINAFVAKNADIIAKNLQGYLHDLSDADIDAAVRSNAVVKLFLQHLRANEDKYKQVLTLLSSRTKNKLAGISKRLKPATKLKMWA